MNDNENPKKMSPKNQEEQFRNALFDAFKSTPRGRDAYIDPSDGCIVLPMVIRHKRKPPPNKNE